MKNLSHSASLHTCEKIAPSKPGIKQLEEAKDNGIARYGIHQQTEALMTCVVPSIMDDGHFHFLDGATGGYAEAARQLRV